MITVLTQMLRGASLCLHYARGGKAVWLLSPGGEVPPEVAALVIAHPDVCGVGDACSAPSSAKPGDGSKPRRSKNISLKLKGEQLCQMKPRKNRT
jgi:hypothetical protein